MKNGKKGKKNLGLSVHISCMSWRCGVAAWWGAGDASRVPSQGGGSGLWRRRATAPSGRPPNGARRCSVFPDARGLGPQSRGTGLSPGADAMPTHRVRRSGEPQRTGRRCGSREATASTGTSPPPSAPDEGPGDRKTNGSVPRPSRREAEPQRRFPAWLAALSRHTGVSRDQPQDRGASSDVNPTGSPGVGHGGRPLARAVTAQRGEWPRSAASSGGRGARGGTPGRGLALPGPAGEFAK